MHDFGNPLQEGVRKGRSVREDGARTFSCTLSNESGESTAKQMRITWESG